jgi:hypothetical protein
MVKLSKRRKSLLIDGYPIKNIRCRASSLAGYAYKIWYWQLESDACDCPLEPLTQEFWRAKQNAGLVDGILIPNLDARARGDILILATQDLFTTLDQGFSCLTIPQILSLHRTILRLSFPQLDFLRSLSFEDRLDLFKELETAFVELIMPRKNEKGEYYRRLHKLETFDPAQAYSLGMGFCPRCKQTIAFRKGLDVMKAYRVDPETVFIFGICSHCRNVIATAINPHFTNLWFPRM